MNNQSPDIRFSSNTPPLTQEETVGLILSNLEDSVALISKDFRIIQLTEKTKKLILRYFGIADAMGMSVLDLMPEKKEELIGIYTDVFNGLERSLETGVNFYGSTVTYESYFRPARNEKGEIIAALVTSRNISDRKRAEIKLKETEERWRFALEGSKQGVWDWNVETGEVYYSTSFKKLYGYEEHEMEHRIEIWEEMIHPDDREKMKEAVREHTSSEDPYYETTYRARAKDGHYKWIMARGMASRNAEGQVFRMIGTHTDITDQVEAEERARLSEQQYKTLFEYNPLPCWIYDADSLQFLEVNQAAIRHYGFSREEFLSSTLYRIQNGDQLAGFDHLVQTNRKSNSIALNNWKHRKKNGDIIFVDLRINTIMYKVYPARLVVAHDVTAKVLVENELRTSNERFSLVARASSEALWEWDVVSGEVFMSEAYTDILGWKVNDNRMFDEWHELVHPDDRKEIISGYYTAVADPVVSFWTNKYRYQKSDGSYAYVNDKAVILRNATGKAVKVIGATQDISDQIYIEEKLRISNDRYKHVIMATSDIVWDWDLKSDEIFWSDNFTRILGWELPASKILKPDFCFTHIHPSDLPGVQASLTELLSHPQQTHWLQEFRYQKADGSLAYLSDRGYLIRNQEGEAIRMVGAMEDITQRKQSEQLLSLERKIFEMSTDLRISFQHLVECLLKGIEEIHPDASASVLLLRDDGIIEPFVAPSLPPEYFKRFQGMRIGNDKGCTAAAMFRKQTVIVENTETDPLCTNIHVLAHEFGMKACWSLPVIHSSGTVMGSFSLYYRQPKSPSREEMNILERIRNILRVLMEHYWSLNEIKNTNERFDIMMKATHDLIWDWNLETNQIYRDEMGLIKVYGLSDNKPIENIYQWLERVHPEDQAMVRQTIEQIQNTTKQDTFDVEYRFKKEDGSYSHVYDRGMIIRNEEGKPVRMIGAAQDITVRKRLEQELLQNELERQKAINQATIDTQELERSEIGKELHDNVNQVLTTTKLYLDLASSNVELKDELIQKASKNIISVINEIRQLSRSLMDPSIGDLGLIDSIHDLIDNINLTRKLHVRLTADKKLEGQLSQTQKLTVFRIIQEALNNALRHARASSVVIRIGLNKKIVELLIEDDGIGFHTDSVKKGAGLKNIQNRIYLINGTQQIITEPQKGCKLVINFPIK